jgi:hypothetical protein
MGFGIADFGFERERPVLVAGVEGERKFTGITG